MRIACGKVDSHAGDTSPSVNGDSRRMIRVLLVGSPGGLTDVVQVFSSLNIPLDRLDYVRDAADSGSATLAACFRADSRTIDLVLRKLTRLIEVLSAKEGEIPDDDPSNDFPGGKRDRDNVTAYREPREKR